MIRILSAVFVAAFMLVSVPAFAQDAVPVWVIDPTKSTLTFEATQQGAAFTGGFKAFGGDIRFDASRPEQSTATIRIDMKTVDSKSGDRDKSLAGSDWFSIESFPESTYTVSKFDKLNDNQYVARGELNLRGVKKALDLPLTITFSADDQGRDTALAVGEVVLNRLDFGVGQGEWKDTQAVGNPVKVKVSVVASRSDAAAQ